MLLLVALLLSLAEILLRIAHGPAWLTFLVAAGTLTVLSVLIGKAGDQMSKRCSPWMTGILQAGLGNIPELLFGLVALHSGAVLIVQYAIIGSALGTMVLVLGCSFLLGGWRHRSLRFDDEPAQNMTFALALTIGALIVSSLLQGLPGVLYPAFITAGIASLLLVFFIICTLHFLALKKADGQEDAASPPSWSLFLTLLVLVGSIADATMVSQFFVEDLEPAMTSLHLSPLFTGLIVVPIAGNIVEHIVGILYAWHNKGNLAVSTIGMSAIQMLTGLFPLLVLLSFLPGFVHLTFSVPTIPLIMLILSLLLVHLAIHDGRGDRLEGWGFLLWYVLLAIVSLAF